MSKYILPWKQSASESDQTSAYIASSWTDTGSDLKALEVRLGDRVYATQDLVLDRQVPLGMELGDFKETVRAALQGSSSSSELDVFIQLEATAEQTQCQVNAPTSPRSTRRPSCQL